MANTQLDLRVGAQFTPTVTVSVLGMGDLLWTVDGDTIQVRAKDTLSVIASFGSTGAGNNQFNAPTHLAADLFSVYVNDAGNSRIKKHVGTTLAFHSAATLADMTLPAVSAISADRRRLLMGKAATDTYVYDRHKNTFVEEHAVFNCGAGGIVGLAVIQDYFFVATSSRVEKRLLADGSLIASWNSLPVTFAVAGLTTDGTYVYVLCTKAATDAKVVRLYCNDLFEIDVNDLTGKQTPYAICCDASYIYFTNVADTTVNRMANTVTGAITSVADITTPRGICCLPGFFSALRPEAVGEFSGTGAMAMAGTAATGPGTKFSATGSMAMAGTAVMGKVSAIAATGSMAMAGTAVLQKVGKIVATGSMAMGGSATIAKTPSFSASGSMAMGGSAVIARGTAQAGDVAVAAATIGLSATTTVATVRY